MANVEVGSLYEMNKDLVNKYEIVLQEEQLQVKKDEIIEFINKTNNKYYMLLSNENKDYTVFKLKDISNITILVDILVDECFKNRGKIKGIDITADEEAFEIWLEIDNQAYVYYFFPYDNAIIEV